MNSLLPSLNEQVGAFLMNDTSQNLFDAARNTANLRKLFCAFTRRSNRLMELRGSTVQKKFTHYAGEREVPLNDIRGTEGRQNDFDDRFNPLSERTRGRWVSVAQARQNGLELPPIELVQVGDVYFVRDGHHRISVARALGRATITARVVVSD